MYNPFHNNGGDMNIRTAVFIAALLPLQALADKGDFSIKIGEKTEVIPSSCVETLSYQPKDEFDSESIIFSLTSSCGKRLSQITRQGIGKTSTFSYRGNVLSSALIVSVLSSNFRISTKEAPKVVLMQLLNDYGVTHE
ncbi:MULTISPECIES: Insecticidal toxin complex protein tccz [unclassified Cedecea]|uniref:Insecticidal toxin complex protein tccz n=1 Tax=unclassified Cedecea TaxID=2649846 RepID=UPI00301A7A01